MCCYVRIIHARHTFLSLGENLRCIRFNRSRLNRSRGKKKRKKPSEIPKCPLCQGDSFLVATEKIRHKSLDVRHHTPTCNLSVNRRHHFASGCMLSFVLSKSRPQFRISHVCPGGENKRIMHSVPLRDAVSGRRSTFTACTWRGERRDIRRCE